MANNKKASDFLKGIIDKATKESADFVQSGKGTNKSNFVEMKGDKAFNPDRNRGSGFGDSYGSKSEWVSKDNPRSMTPKQLSDFISQHAAGNHGAKLDDFSNGLKIGGNMQEIRPKADNYMNNADNYMNNADNYMTKGFGGGEKNYMTKGDDSLTKFNAKDFYGKGLSLGSIKKTTLGKGGLSNDDINVIGFTGAAGAGLGEGISSAMDDSYSAGKQNAQSYWTNKKNTDRGGK